MPPPPDIYKNIDFDERRNKCLLLPPYNKSTFLLCKCACVFTQTSVCVCVYVCVLTHTHAHRQWTLLLKLKFVRATTLNWRFCTQVFQNIASVLLPDTNWPTTFTGHSHYFTLSCWLSRASLFAQRGRIEPHWMKQFQDFASVLLLATNWPTNFTGHSHYHVDWVAWVCLCKEVELNLMKWSRFKTLQVYFC